MEELHCKGTPAQVARRVLGVLAEDPDLLWLIDQYKNYPRPLPKALNELDGRRVPNELENWPVIIIHLFGKLSNTGDIRAEPLPQYVLLTADARVLKIWHDGQQQRHQITEDFSELAPIWEKVKAELNRRGMVIEAEPAQAKRDEEAPRIGAPRLAELDDAQATAKKNKLREYLRLILRPRDPQKKEVAAGQVGLARTTLDRYRRTWPEIEAEVKQELGAHKVRKA